MKSPLLALIMSLVSSPLAFSAPQSDSAAATPVGLQLYSLRQHFKKDVPSTLQLAADAGVKYVETAGTYGMEPAKFRDLLASKGLVAVSGHFPFEQLEKDPAAMAAEAKALSLSHAGCAWIPHKGSFTEQDARHAAAVFNRAGEEMNKVGVRFFYHCHGYEFEPRAEGKLMDLLMKECDPVKVTFQMDVAWLYLPGEDPVAWLKKYAGRWELMHIKDLMPEVARGSHSGGTDVNKEAIIGQGQLDWKQLLKVAKETGVKVFILEDEHQDAATRIPASMAYLKSFAW